VAAAATGYADTIRAAVRSWVEAHVPADWLGPGRWAGTARRRRHIPWQDIRRRR